MPKHPPATLEPLPTPKPSAQAALYFPLDAPWSQLEDEPDELYAQFVFFLGMGPSRTITRASELWLERFGYTRRHKSGRPPAPHARDGAGNWDINARSWRWRERAARFDVYTIRQVVPEIAGIIFESIKLYALKVHEVLSDPNVKPKGWREASEAIEALTRFISPESIALAALHHAGDAGTDSNSLTVVPLTVTPQSDDPASESEGGGVARVADDLVS